MTGSRPRKAVTGAKGGPYGENPKSATLDSPEARTALRARQEPYWHRIEQGLFLGYRKSKAGGRWILRRYRATAAPGHSRYLEKALGVADDHRKADGAEVLGHSDARMVTKHYGHLAPSHVADAIRAALPKFGRAQQDNVTDVRARKA